MSDSEIKEINNILELENNKKCSICLIYKKLDNFIKNKLIKDNKVSYKNKCKDCYKIESKQFYNKNKHKILKSIKDKTDKLRKLYNIKIKFNDENDLTNIYNNLIISIKNNTLEKYIPNNNKSNKNSSTSSDEL